MRLATSATSRTEVPMKQPLPAVLASGAWLKNTACLLDHGQVRWSALHGDLQDPAACCQLEASLRALAREARAPVAAVAHDLHPDFYSTRIAIALAKEWGVPAIAVQHHHAHIAAVMAEHGLDEPVIGLALDGVGLGTDGTAWGGELLRVSGNGWERLGSLWPLVLPAARRRCRGTRALAHGGVRPARARCWRPDCRALFAERRAWPGGRRAAHARHRIELPDHKQRRPLVRCGGRCPRLEHSAGPRGRGRDGP
jgi:hydrogenase maturation factor HypF (carbamoyltransferase family)